MLKYLNQYLCIILILISCNIGYSIPKSYLINTFNENQIGGIRNSNNSDQITDSTRIRLYQKLSIAHKEGDKSREVDLCISIGDSYGRISCTDSTLYYYQTALELGRTVDYKRYFPTITYKIADLYWNIGKYSQALENALLLKDFYEKENTLEDQPNLLNLIGITYLRLQDYNTALENLKHSAKISERKKNFGLLGISLANIGNLYLRQHMYVEALENYEKGVKLEEENNQFLTAGRSYESIGDIYLSLDNPQKAEEFLGKAINYNHKTSDIIGYSRTYCTYGKLYNYLRNYNKAIEYLKKAEEFAIKSDVREYYMNTCEQFAIAYQNINDSHKALYYKDKYITFYKQIYSIQDYAGINKLENELRIEKSNNALIKIEVEKQRYINILFIIVFILSFTIGGLFMLLYIRSVRSKKALMKINIEVQNQKEHLQLVNDELEEAKSNAEKANQVKGHFLRNISHEIRTPLNGMVGFSELLASTNTTEEEKDRYLSLIKSSGNQLISTIENLVEMAHISTNQIRTHNTKVNLNEFVDEIYSTYSSRLVRNRYRISFNCEKGKGNANYLTTDKDLLRKIIVQLLENSIKFTKTGDITIGYVMGENKLKLFIKDTGIGISEDYQNIIYESFRQEQESLTREYEGVGIGLSIAKKLSELLGADLTFESKKDFGTTFYLAFER